MDLSGPGIDVKLKERKKERKMWKHSARCTFHFGPLLGFGKSCCVGVQGFVFQIEEPLVVGPGNIFKNKTGCF